MLAELAEPKGGGTLRADHLSKSMQNANPYAVRSFATDIQTRQHLAVLTRAQGVSQSEAIRQAIAEAAARLQEAKKAA